MKQRGLRNISVLIILLLLSSMIIGCSKGDNGSVETKQDVANANKPIEINVGLATGWDTLSPFRSNVGNNLTTWSTIVYESLGYLNEDNELVPWIAKEWDTADNGMTYDVTIYDYIKDSAGNEITSSDIAWFVNEAKKRALKPNFKYVESVEITSDYSFKVVFNNSLVGVFETFMTDTFAVSQVAYESQGDDFVNSCITTSPYKVTAFTSGSTCEFTKRSDYWQKEELLPPQLHANVDKCTVHTIPEAAQLGIALETGVVDFAMEFQPSTAVQFEDVPEYTLQKGKSRNGMTMYFSGASNRIVAEDKYLRQAICYALDNQLMINAVLEGYGEEMHDSASTFAIGYLKKWLDEEYYPYNIEKAKECLSKSNYNGEELVLLASSTTKTVSEIIQNCCAAVGINVKLNLVQMALLTAIRLDGTQYDMFINQVGGITLANHWNTRYDARAYKTGDATSRHDMVLADMIRDASTVEGFTPENIDKVHEYIKENAYGYGMYQPQVIAVWRNGLGIKEVVNSNIKLVVPTACKYN